MDRRSVQSSVQRPSGRAFSLQRERNPHCHEAGYDSSIYFRNARGDLIDAVCINLDVQPYVHARDALSELVGQDDPVSPEAGEIFGTEVGDALGGLVQLAVSRVGILVSAMTRDDKVAAMRLLDQKGAVLVRRAIDQAASFIGGVSSEFVRQECLRDRIHARVLVTQSGRRLYRISAAELLRYLERYRA